MANPDFKKPVSPEIQMNVPPEGMRREFERPDSGERPEYSEEGQPEVLSGPTQEVLQTPADVVEEEQSGQDDPETSAEIDAGHIENIKPDKDPADILTTYLNKVFPKNQ